MNDSLTNDPWRYTMPCGHHCFRRRNMGGHQGRMSNLDGFVCDNCGKKSRYVIDKKTGKEVGE